VSPLSVQLARALVRALGRALGLALGAVTAGGQLASTPGGIELEQVGAVLDVCGQAPRHPSRGLAGLGLGRRAPAPSAPCFSGFSMRLLLALLVRVCVIELLARRRTCAPRLCHAHGHSHTLTAGPASHRRARGCTPTWTTLARVVAGPSAAVSLCRCVAVSLSLVLSLATAVRSHPVPAPRRVPHCSAVLCRAEGWLAEHWLSTGRQQASESPSPHLTSQHASSRMSAFPAHLGAAPSLKTCPPASTRVDAALLHRMTRCCLFRRWLFLGWPST
jgi:hypothetical protein